MTKRQRLAFERPCLIEEQCATDGYRWLRLPWSVILTLNVGLDDAAIFDRLPIDPEDPRLDDRREEGFEFGKDCAIHQAV